MEQVGAKLLDMNAPLDVAMLDEVVACMQNPNNPHHAMANEIMVAFQGHQDSWTRVSQILETSTYQPTKYFGLQILEDAIKYKWFIMPKEQREGIKQYIVGKILTLAADETTMRKERLFINKLNLVLVQVLKHEWPKNWPTFITDICTSSQKSEVLCENNMLILKLLSEEIFDFSKDQMTEKKTKALKESLNHEFVQIFRLCEFVLDKSTHIPLLTITLQTLLRFLSWIPLGFIFETNLVETLVKKFFATQAFRNDTIACLSEIATLTDVPQTYDNVYVQMYLAILHELARIVPPGHSMERIHHLDSVFVQGLSLFFTNFFRHHIRVIEQPITRPSDEAHIALLTGFQYLISISEVDDENIFKICLDYWHLLTRDLYSLDQNQAQSHGMNVLALTRRAAEPDPLSRKSLLKVILSRLRVVMISKMVKPSEVLIVEDENGEIVRETTKDTEALSQYKTMHEGLVYLTHLDYDDTETIMLEKLTDQVEGNGWSWNNLNTLCWAIGSISGAMSEENEKRFLVTVIKDLLGLCEMKRGKDNKAVVASNIMYVVGQYPRFLRAHWKFLKTVVNKLFEFMHELHPGVQDMACDTFLKIAQKCRRKFVVLQPGEPYPFVEELMMELPKTVSDLEPHQLHTFYEAVASMLAAETVPARKDTLVAELMKLPNAAWQNLMQQAAQNVDVLFDPQAVKEIVKIIRTNGNVCKAIGPNGFNSQMGAIFQDLLNVYRTYTQRIAQRVAHGGEHATKTSEVRSLRNAKKESLRLFEAFVEHSSADENGRQTIARHFLPLLLEVVLSDYKTTVANAKESEVLTLLATCISKLKHAVAPSAPGMLEAVFECTLEMITRNFEDFPEHRVNFFKLLKAVNEFCVEALFNIPAEHFKLVVDSIVWAFKHTERTVADTVSQHLRASFSCFGANGWLLLVVAWLASFPRHPRSREDVSFDMSSQWPCLPARTDRWMDRMTREGCMSVGTDLFRLVLSTCIEPLEASMCVCVLVLCHVMPRGLYGPRGAACWLGRMATCVVHLSLQQPGQIR
ncbi:hypothetical protein, variant 4 [Aphanomyces invadans]|uniref:Exportin-1 n=1 Tax=Aphanomyces invadans TaxID=157072 RepID=A0A024TDG1_9STRA|nr:hypothetical protein, variant 4 [Aphanomyces invadans]XP_008879258.1 hypothetical protein, variant 3 [Aphanomyces invadans]XP_008879259.1 hypothetical protein, variant 1 [Aphanomyces invadans]XP_008879260.1 hypothetical protein, variant 2 [Aphanomyces invadans]ETV92091.1 hypothetical protein, variant 1 [Aphanomyces invadans]ETV92092.1 hypothetical protein, variant 2 [Aphanomyces invadans]ETV92093.1 hypothetical protein, variant 3 [Aphanomyces invadans]ETV92094.1 hypothetical protein, vari|eukprot:XP_008879253.1 hypothetical protein, variant 4 [Aphanomyces invadans]